MTKFEKIIQITKIVLGFIFLGILIYGIIELKHLTLIADLWANKKGLLVK